MEIFTDINYDDIFKVKRALLEQPELISLKDDFGNTPFLHSVFKKKWDIARYLMFEDLKNIDNYNKKQETALMYACRYGNLDFVKLLIKNGADINKSSLYIGPVIFYAFEALNKRVLQYLVKNGAFVNAKNRYGETLLIKSIENDEVSTLFWLIQNGAEGLDSALISAVLFNNLEAVKLLLEYGGDINTINLKGESILVLAIRSKNWDIAEYLFKKGALIRCSGGCFGWEVLNSAYKKGKLALVKKIVAENKK